MEPIINPWMIYLIGNIEQFVAFFGVIGWLTFIGAVVLWIVYYVEKLPLTFPRFICTTIGALFIIISVVLPSSKTLTAMVIANEITYDRVDSLKATVGDIHNIVKQDIIDMIQEIKRDEVKTESK